MARYQPHDTFYRKARERGLPSRAAFKIEELLARFRLARPGARIVDLGCAPGGWLKLLADAAGPQGRVVGVDLAACAPPASNVATLAGDIRESAAAEAIAAALGGPADLVTSDLAPKLSGVAERDQARMAELAEAALGCARRLLRPGGAMVVKLFMGGDFQGSLRGFERDFSSVELTRPRASRPGSSELYVIARGFRASSGGRDGGDKRAGSSKPSVLDKSGAEG